MLPFSQFMASLDGQHQCSDHRAGHLGAALSPRIPAQAPQPPSHPSKKATDRVALVVGKAAGCPARPHARWTVPLLSVSLTWASACCPPHGQGSSHGWAWALLSCPHGEHARLVGIAGPCPALSQPPLSVGAPGSLGSLGSAQPPCTHPTTPSQGLGRRAEFRGCSTALPLRVGVGVQWDLLPASHSPFPSCQEWRVPWATVSVLGIYIPDQVRPCHL